MEEVIILFGKAHSDTYSSCNEGSIVFSDIAWALVGPPQVVDDLLKPFGNAVIDEFNVGIYLPSNPIINFVFVHCRECY